MENLSCKNMDSFLAFMVIAISAVKIIAQYLFQLSLKKHNSLYVWIGIGCYAFFGYLVHQILSVSNSLAITNIIASNVSDIIIILMGWVVFKQVLKPVQMVGVVAVLFGAYLVSQ